MASGRIDGSRLVALLIVVVLALAGIARARAEGTRSGKAVGLSADREAAVRASLAAGTGIRRR
jgi:hypothetical protein